MVGFGSGYYPDLRTYFKMIRIYSFDLFCSLIYILMRIHVSLKKIFYRKPEKPGKLSMQVLFESD